MSTMFVARPYLDLSKTSAEKVKNAFKGVFFCRNCPTFYVKIRLLRWRGGGGGGGGKSTIAPIGIARRMSLLTVT